MDEVLDLLFFTGKATTLKDKKLGQGLNVDKKRSS
jgi:hypothetical protein